MDKNLFADLDKAKDEKNSAFAVSTCSDSTLQQNNADRKELEEELINEKLSFTKIWVDFVLKSTNKEWSSQQKKFIDALVENSRKNSKIIVK